MKKNNSKKTNAQVKFEAAKARIFSKPETKVETVKPETKVETVEAEEPEVETVEADAEWELPTVEEEVPNPDKEMMKSQIDFVVAELENMAETINTEAFITEDMDMLQYFKKKEELIQEFKKAKTEIKKAISDYKQMPDKITVKI